MKKYIAKSYIGGYNAGDEIPEGKALVWKQMYKVWPVEVVEVPEEVPKPRVVQEEVKKEETVEVPVQPKPVLELPKKVFGKKK